jgi:hypothetical protein
MSNQKKDAPEPETWVERAMKTGTKLSPKEQRRFDTAIEAMAKSSAEAEKT